MSVTVRIHPFLRKFTGGQKIVEVECKTIGECIENLEVKFPGIKQPLCDKEGMLHTLWDIYVNSASCYPEEFAKPVKDGDELTIVAIMAGG
jgi:molybdopterin synthase sulfur carrier subunit